MKTRDSENTCPQCGRPIPQEAPQGLCPKCVLAGAATAADADPPPSEAPDVPSIERVAAAFPQLEVIELIGRGGMGFVFKARQRHLDRFVALKLLPERLAKDPKFAERFNREGRVLAKLSHPNIVTVYDFGHTEHFYYLMMEHVDGVNLRQAMQAGRFSPTEALSIVPKICAALQFAHEQQVLHRDIKPENILLDTSGRVKIADFGIAKLVGDDAEHVTLTHTGSALGTPHYMAPEQLEQPGTVDHRADIYSLGVVFYEMLTGELPIGRFAPPSSKTPVSEGVDEVVFRALEKDRERRQRSAQEFQTEVQTASETTDQSHSRKEQASSPDFVLCHPALPRMAQAMTVYGLLLAPALWFLGLLTIEPPRQANPYLTFVDHLTLWVTQPGFLLGTILWFIGALRLRKLRKSGPRFITAAVLTNILFAGLTTAGMVWGEMLVQETEAASRISSGDAILMVVGLAAVIFELTVLIWLWRNRVRLRELFEQAAVSKRTKSSAKAVWGTVLVSLSLALVAVPAVLVATTIAGLGIWEIVFLGGPAILMAITGTILGWLALGEMRHSGGSGGALPLALFAALTFPIGGLGLGTIGLTLAAATRLPGPPFPAKVVIIWIAAGALALLITMIGAIGQWASGSRRNRYWRSRRWAAITLGVGVLGTTLLVLTREQPDSYVPEAERRLASEVATGKRLPEGVVELLALSTHPSDGTWWKPDGSPWTNAPFKNPGVSQRGTAEDREVELVLRVDRGDYSSPGVEYILKGSQGWAGGGSPVQDGKTVPGGILLAASFPKSLPTTTIAVGVADGPWETLIEEPWQSQSSISLVRDSNPLHVEFLGAIEDKKGNTVLTIAHNIDRFQVRVVAVDGQGAEKPSLLVRQTRDHLRATFVAMPLESIQKFRVQIRPYRWAVFEDVALVPLHREGKVKHLLQPGVEMEFHSVDLIEEDQTQRIELGFEAIGNEADLSWNTSGQFSELSVDLQNSTRIIDQGPGKVPVEKNAVSLQLPSDLTNDEVLRVLQATREKWQGRSLVVQPGDTHAVLTMNQGDNQGVVTLLGRSRSGTEQIQPQPRDEQ